MAMSKLYHQQHYLIQRAYQVKQKYEQRCQFVDEQYEHEKAEIEETYRRALIQWEAKAVELFIEGLFWKTGCVATSVVVFIILLLLVTHVAFWLLLILFIFGLAIYNIIKYRYNSSVTARRNDLLSQTTAIYDKKREEDLQLWHSDVNILSQEFDAYKREFARGAESDYSGNDWNSARWSEWSPVKRSNRVARLGTVTPPIHPPLPDIPILAMPLGEKNILFKTSVEGMPLAKRAMQSLLCRLLATQPPGKVLFTLVDPETVGQNAAPFMELAIYNEELVTKKIWVEPPDIEQQLQNLTEHIERINRMYLGRGGYSSLEEYHDAIGEIVEPYRILVVWDFPVNFSKEVAKRLVSVAVNGPRCGVSTIVLYNTGILLPEGFDILTDWEAGVISEAHFTRHLTGLLRTKQLVNPWDTEQFKNEEQLKRISNLVKWEGVADVFEWQNGHFIWHDPDFEQLSLHFDELLSPTLFDTIIEQVGMVSKDSTGVHVGFGQVMPPRSQWLSGDASDGISVSIGRPLTGRVDRVKQQMLELGYEETLQHVFVGGMTGSGKSVSLKVLIANLALKYSPDEIILYLLDFKRVSFVPFVNCLLPHVRVVAIESDREFALSVLKEIFNEFQTRQRLFTELGLARKADIDSIAKYRRISGKKLARIILVADELQVLVSVGDEIKEQCLSLLTNLAKQGRTFGIHIILATQTLTGTDMNEVSREFISQFGIRTVFKSPDDDARRMLSDDNPAAKDLRGKGHGIYNPSGGNKSVNNEFQGANFADEDSKHLSEMLKLAKQRGYVPLKKQIVFKGYEPASVDENDSLKALLSQPVWQKQGSEVRIWLGDPIDITAQTSISLRHKAHSNLLLLGMQEEYAQGILVTALITLAAQHRPNTVCFYILDFSGTSAFRNLLAHAVGRPGGHMMRVAKGSEAVTVVRDIRKEIEMCERNADDQIGEKQETHTEPTIYLFVYGLPRQRDMQRRISEESDETLAEALCEILRDGPPLRVHTLLWCEDLRHLEESLDLYMFDKRVLFQMSADDVREIVGSRVAPAGKDRALFYSEGDEIRLEKFRPYPVPSANWLQKASEAIQRKQ